ncbi:hypothetical protein [Methylobacterium aerolatum]|uniref:Lipoprotein n=1 Tax=Methylobacterium aerolatum TaxID=418708 RepID=A0ABU0I2J7_9HYPH|nr:hypothetical protein [Methylobacterium aerolatum]MDQ0448258.1 hypothetical protein [Methylobacterium aerolatum]GJD35739.1 hypothetical protein FMGBMHLM_2651 [Methylobacterium aerolatum]
MKTTTLIAAAGLISLGTAAFATESGPATQTTTGNAVTRMQGSPNAAGFGKDGAQGAARGDVTGSTATAPGAATQDGKMHGSPNASGFKGGATTGSGR